MSGFSSKEASSLERTVDVGLDACLKLTSSDALELYYDIERCVEWIKDIKAQKICLQFPDALLGDSVNVALSLEKRIGAKVYILGDTSYGSCCVDEVAAQHVAGDAIIHFGKACLSPTSRLPVLYIFEKYELDIDDFISSFESNFTSDSKVLVLYEVYYSHLTDTLREKLSSKYPNVIVSNLTTESTPDNSEDKTTKKLGREFTLAEGSNLRDYQVIFIGKDGRTLSNFVMDMDGATFHLYDPDAAPDRLKAYEYQKSKFLMRRLYLVERVKDARTLGVVVGTLGVSNYLGAVDRVKQLAKRSGKKSYIVAVGKPNVAKLANFPEIEIFVLIACSENCLLDSKEFYRPIVTPYEVELALNEKRELGQTYVTDFRELLLGGSHYSDLEDLVPGSDDRPTDVSLISGRLRNVCPADADECEGDAGTIALRGDTTLSTLSSGGDFLSARSWQGLEQKLGQTEVKVAVMGRSGIAQGYTSDLDAMSASRQD